MMRSLVQWIPVLLLALAGAGFSFAEPLSPPRSMGELKLSEEEESFETTRFRRLHFSGDIRMAGDPPTEFVHLPSLRDKAALTFRHEVVKDAVIRFWVYENKGAFRFSDEVWNRQLEEWIEALPRRYTANVERWFLEAENSGPPILGYISIQALVTIEDSETQEKYRQRFFLVPVAETDFVLLLSLSSGKERFSYFNGIFDSFVRRLYTLSPEEE